MADFRVVHIVDGDTFDVSPGWQWEGHAGARVRPAGYNAPELHEPGGQAAKEKLARLLLNQTVTLGPAHRLDRGRVVCEVHFQGRNLAEYFASPVGRR